MPPRLIIAIATATATAIIAANTASAANVCKPDALRLCQEAVAARDLPAVKACLVKNLDKVSPACHAEITARMAKASAKPGSPGAN